jgi:hypothetical protein
MNLAETNTEGRWVTLLPQTPRATTTGGKSVPIGSAQNTWNFKPPIDPVRRVSSQALIRDLGSGTWAWIASAMPADGDSGLGLTRAAPGPTARTAPHRYPPMRAALGVARIRLE